MTEKHPDVGTAAVPQKAYPPGEIRRWDHRAIHEFGLPGVVLMENAGAGAARLVLENAAAFPPPYHIFCGPGNNGGDGFVVARHLHNHGLPVRLTVIVPGSGEDRPAYAPDSGAGINFEVVRRMGLDITLVDARQSPAPAPQAPGRGTLLDALFGTGLSRPITSPYLEWLVALGQSPCPVVALDTPSGLDARTGEILGTCLRASLTITFAARKTGFELGSGPDVTGEVQIVDIGIPREIWHGG